MHRLMSITRHASFLVVVGAVFGAMVLAVVVREVLALTTSSLPLPEITPVIVAEVQQREFADLITAVGTARASESVAVTSKVSDVISRIMFESGDQVEGGQVLAELVDTEEAAVLNEARATLAEARREHARVLELAERGVVPAQHRDESQSDLERAVAQVHAIEARMDNRLIRAPFAGVVGLRNISEGELIDNGTVIATLNNLSVIKLDFTVPERFFSAIAPGQRVNARTSAYPDEIFTGQIANIDNQVDRVSRTITVRAEIPNDDSRLVPGMLLSVEVLRDERERPAIPESALVRMANQAGVFVVEPDGENAHTARHRDVQVGLRTGGLIEVLAGLEPGEWVVADGTHRTRDGAPVRITGRRDGSRTILEPST